MLNEEIILTPQGMEKIEKELDYLKTTKRKEIASRIKAAISFGDIAENSEYEDAKNEQAFVEGRIATLEKWLRNATLLKKENNANGMVCLGDTVKLADHGSGEEFVYTIVGTAEADPTENKISNESPVGRAILGQKVGSIITVEVPAGSIDIEIKEIS
ncbi:MAG: transcription elongation factor GreA [Firmicutes bacterium]|jgi:transcription elongation factor GreA|nr:transcription elongation factor GreA [Bacillota bacterium]